MDAGELVSLTELLAQNAESIMDKLIVELKENGGPAYRQLNREVLQRRVQRLFDAFWQGISQNSSRPLTEYIWSTSRDRGSEGVTVADLRIVGLRLRDALLEVVDQTYADHPELHLRYSRQIEELILSGIGAGVEGFVDGREALIARQFEALRRTLKRKNNAQAKPGNK